MPNISMPIVGLAGVALSLAVVAAEERIDIKTDLKGEFFIVEKSGTPDRPIVVVKNTGPGFTNFIKREFDCAAHTVRYLGDGESLKDVAAAQPEAKMGPIVAGSIPDQLSQLVCPSKSGENAGGK